MWLLCCIATYALVYSPTGREVITIMNEEKESSLVHTFDPKASLLKGKLIALIAIVVILGISTGFYFAKSGVRVGSTTIGGKNSGSSAPKGMVVGSNDTSVFKDTVEGRLQEGGINGEGQFHLVRPGGDSQNVYLTSSIVDLSQFKGKKIKVWGQTQKAQTAGWLMDVGKVEVLE